jgi:large subunit ribosomal protein L25
MKALKLSGSLRENVGKRDAKMLRKAGNVPCVLYGGDKQVHFVMAQKAFKELIFTPKTYLVELLLGGKTYNAILQDAQYHPVSESILHVDFVQIADDREVVISVPVVSTGTSKGVLKGGRLFKKYRKLKVKALPGNLPDEIVVDITTLGINDSIKVSDLKRENLAFLDPPTSVVLMVKSARAPEADEDELHEEEAEGAEGAEGTDGAKHEEGGEGAHHHGKDK